MVSKKICTKCRLELDLYKFGKSKQNKIGYLARCIDCTNEYKEIWYLKNKETVDQYRKDYRKEHIEKNRKRSLEHYKNNREYYLLNTARYNKNNKEKILQKHKDYYKNNKEEISRKSKLKYAENPEKYKQKRKLDYLKNKEIILKKQKEYRIKNREKINKKVNLRKKTDPLFKLKYSCRNRTLTFLKKKNLNKRYKFSEYIGCTVFELKLHLEQKFVDGMCWENHGKVWEIDHIIPLASAKTEEEVYRLLHYTNLQPLFCLDNRRKSGKIPS